MLAGSGRGGNIQPHKNPLLTGQDFSTEQAAPYKSAPRHTASRLPLLSINHHHSNSIQEELGVGFWELDKVIPAGFIFSFSTLGRHDLLPGANRAANSTTSSDHVRRRTGGTYCAGTRQARRQDGTLKPRPWILARRAWQRWLGGRPAHSIRTRSHRAGFAVFDTPQPSHPVTTPGRSSTRKRRGEILKPSCRHYAWAPEDFRGSSQWPSPRLGHICRSAQRKRGRVRPGSSSPRRPPECPAATAIRSEAI